MTPMFLMDRIVKKRSLSALSFQFLFIVKATRSRAETVFKSC
jgi:hypothetical protein